MGGVELSGIAVRKIHAGLGTDKNDVILFPPEPHEFIRGIRCPLIPHGIVAIGDPWFGQRLGNGSIFESLGLTTSGSGTVEVLCENHKPTEPASRTTTAAAASPAATLFDGGLGA